MASGEQEFDEDMESLRWQHAVGHALQDVMDATNTLRDEGFLLPEEFKIIERTMEGASGRLLEKMWGLDDLE